MRRWSGSSSILNLVIFDSYDVVSNFAVKRAHNLIGSFSGHVSSYVACVCNHCCWTNQNRRSMIVLRSHISCGYEAFYSYRISFSLITSLKMMGLGPGHLVQYLFRFSLEITLVVSLAQYLKWWSALFCFLMVKWWINIFHFSMVKWWIAVFYFQELWIHFVMVKWGNLVESQKYLPNLVESQKYFPKLVESQNYIPNLVESQKYFPKLVESQKYFLAQKLS